VSSDDKRVHIHKSTYLR